MQDRNTAATSTRCEPAARHDEECFRITWKSFCNQQPATPQHSQSCTQTRATRDWMHWIEGDWMHEQKSSVA